MKVINKLTSRSERERESSLSSLSLKKSFTLIELSIVLLILSLLVGSLLVGRQIVDRAKIQRIIFEFDYYEKAFHQFYDTYRVVPGNLGEQEAKKYSEFSKLIEHSHGTNQTGLFSDTKSANNRKLVQSHYYGAYVTTMCQLQSYIDNEHFVSNISGKFFHCKHNKGNSYEVIGCNKGIEVNAIGWLQSRAATSTFDDRVFIHNIGFTNKGLNRNPILCTYPNTGNMGNMKNAPEETNKTWFMSSYGHNALFMFRIVSAEVSLQNNTQGTLSAKMTSELDAKIDDGRPATGKILAVKSGFARKASANDDEIKAVCYDQLVPNVDKAIYNSSNDLKFGCNLVKIMEDVK